MEQEFAVTIAWREGYQFDVEFDESGEPSLRTDEPPPLGSGAGPNPARLLAAAVGSCMSASLRFCLERAHVSVQGLTTRVEGTLVRNQRGRLRIGSLHVALSPVADPAALDRLGRCVELFEDFCIVGQSVRDGIDLAVDVQPVGAPAAA